MSDRMGPDEPTFGVVNDRYALEEIVGSGGMGVVYRGRDRVLGRVVAVKMIRQELAGEEFVRRFEREAAILARLRSPYIVVVYDYGEHDDKFFMITDFLTEGDLSDWLERNGPMPVVEAVPLVAKLAEGLADAHEAGVLHRDIKPANTLLWRRGGRLHPVLADFGIAVTSDLTLTKTGAIVGSPLYMAPERHRGEPATVASDIYAMGCLLYAILTGQPPYWGGTEFQAASAHLNDPIPTLPDSIPHASELDVVIAACLAKRPSDRIGSADELADRLKGLAERIAPAAALAEPPTAPPAPPSGTPSTVGGEVPPSGATTVLSPTDPRSSGPSVPAPLPAAGTDGAGGRRSPVLAVVAAIVAVVAVAAGLGWWAFAGDEEDPGAGRAPTTGTSVSESGSPTAQPPDAPDKVRLTAAGGDLEVRFKAKVPAPSAGVTYRLEIEDDGWRPSRAAFKLPTPVGGKERCAVVRLVAVNGDGETPGAETKECDRSRPPDIELVRNTTSCTFPPPAEAIPCRWWDVEFSGFAADRTLEFTIQHDLAENQGVPPAQGQVSTDGNGHYYLGARTDPNGQVHIGGFQAPTATSRITITAGGRTTVFKGADLR